MKKSVVLLLVLLALGLGIGAERLRAYLASRPSRTASLPAPPKEPLTTNQIASRLAGFRSLVDTPGLYTALETFMNSLPPDQVPFAARHAASALEPRLQYAVLARACNRWAADDGRAAADFVTSDVRSNREQLLTGVFEVWARYDAPAMAAWGETNASTEVRSTALGVRVRQLAESDALAAFTLAERIPLHTHRRMAQSAVLQKWLEADPGAATRKLAEIPSEEDSAGLIDRGFTRWLDRDSAAALGWLKQLADTPRRRRVVRVAAAVLATTQPTNAFTIITSLPLSDDRQHAFATRAHTWSARDPHAALAWARSLPAGTDRNSALSAVLQRLIEYDLPAASTLAEAEPDSPAVLQNISQLARRKTDQNAEAAFAWFKKLPEGKTREAVLPPLMAAWADKAPEAAARAAQSLDPATRMLALRQVIAGWGQKDAPAAGAFLLSMPAEPQLNYQYSRVAESWLERDPEAAAEWVTKLPSGEYRGPAEGAIITGLSKADPAKAAAFLVKVGSDSSYQVQTVLTAWLRHDTEAAARWVEALPAGPLRRHGVRLAALELMKTDPARAAQLAEKGSRDTSFPDYRADIALAWAEVDPAAAAAWATRQATNFTRSVAQSIALKWAAKFPADAARYALTITNVSDRSYAAESVIRQWAGRDPKACADWVVALPAGAQQENFIRTLMYPWCKQDAAGAVKWAGGLTGAPRRDHALAAAAGALGGEQPELAASAAESISEERARLRALENVARAWLRDEPTRARAWVQTNSLPDARKKLLLEPRGR